LTRFFLFISISITFLSCNIKTAKDYFAEAENLEEQQKYREAIPILDKAILKDNKFLGAYINRGADKSAIGDFRGAITDYENVISLDPKNTLAYFNIGNNLKRIGDNKTAVDYYNKAFNTKGGDGFYLDLQPNSVIDLSSFDVPGHEIYYERGIALYQIDSLQKAFSDFQNCITKNYMVAESNYWIGNIFLLKGKQGMACEYFYKAKSLGDKDAENSIRKYCN